MGMISGLNALDWVGTLLQSGCGEEAALISDTQGQVRIKSPLNTLPPYVCVGGRGGSTGLRWSWLFRASVSIAVKCTLAHADLPAPGPRPVPRTVSGRRLLKALCRQACHTTPSLCHHGTREALLLSPQDVTNAPDLDKCCWLWDLQTPGPRGPPELQLTAAHITGAPWPGHLPSSTSDCFTRGTVEWLKA